MTQKDGGPAFPRPEKRGVYGEIEQEHQPGMSLRDYFAGQALAGMMSAPNDYNKPDVLLAQDAYAVADAMLRAREEYP